MADDELAALKLNLDGALEAFRSAEVAEGEARRRRCDAQNTLNTAQKQFDAYVEKLRGEAPCESDWGHNRLPRVRAA